MATAMATSGRAPRSAPHQAANAGAALSVPQPLRVRVEINSFASMPKYAHQKDLFIQAYAAVQGKPVDDIKSFYQIAGIHGLPYQSYDNVEGQGNGKWPDPTKPDRWGGYCQHGSQLFPTWHRPYVLLLENAIREEAATIAQSYPNTPAHKDKPTPTVRDLYVEAAKDLSLPYWDWASAQTADFGLPTIMSSPTYQVRTADSYPKKTDYPNPLRAYTLPEDLGSLKQTGDCFNPTAKPNYKVPLNNVHPFTPKGYWTTRHPDANYQTQVDAVNQAVQMYANVMWRPNLHALLDVDNWFPFSNHTAFGKDVEADADYGWYTSIEIVHDGVHDALGGSGGQISYPDIAGFDPAFFLHHANVDRIIALWQACHPDAWIDESAPTERGTFTEPEGSRLNASTALTPFRKALGDPASPCYTSDDVRHVADLGYTYPELQKKLTPDKLKAQLKAKYKPDAYEGLRWSVALKRIPKRIFGGSFTIHVFLDLPYDPTPGHPALSDPHYVGPISIFARGNDTRCASCRINDDVRVRGRLDITNTMLKLGLDVDQEPSEDGGQGAPVPHITADLKAAIKFMVIDKSGQQKDWAPDPSDYAIHKQRKDITDLVPIVPASSGEKRASRGGASGPAAKVAKK